MKNDVSEEKMLKSQKGEINTASEVNIETEEKAVVSHSSTPLLREASSEMEKVGNNHKLKFIRKTHKKRRHYPEDNQEDIMEISVYLFIPLVIFILIATIVSVAGFLYLVFNYSTATCGLEEKRVMHSKKELQDLIKILRLKNHVAKKKKKEKKQSSYIQEPESEGKVLSL
jgi:hypothetical protein